VRGIARREHRLRFLWQGKGRRFVGGLIAHHLRVEQSLEQTNAGLRFKPPKSQYGRRTITIPPAVVADLRAHRKATQERRLTLGLGRSTATDLVFTTAQAQCADQRLAARQRGHRPAHQLACPASHPRLKPDLAAGVDTLTISRRLGHANPKITLDDYGHLYSNTDDKAAAAVEAMFAHRGGVRTNRSAGWQSGGNVHICSFRCY
jgi:hypothetical protein